MTRLLTVADIALRLGVSISYVNKNWPAWIAYGVNPIRLSNNPASRLRFRESDIESMLRQWEMSPAMGRTHQPRGLRPSRFLGSIDTPTA